LPGFKCRVFDFPKAYKDEVFLFPYDVQCLYEKPFDGFLVQMRRGAFLPAVKFMVALPDHPAVFVVGKNLSADFDIGIIICNQPNNIKYCFIRY
ncbi:MAG: hypothetical protein K1W27_12690, partial [Lachnospiraceae bacterium]